jgi:hypothetical protein
MAGTYQSCLDLPGAYDLAAEGPSSVDERLAAMQPLAARIFRQFEQPRGGDDVGGGGGDDDGDGGSEGGRWGGGPRRGGDVAAGGWGLALSDGESDDDWGA